MPVNASKNRFTIDAAMIFRAKGLAAITVDTATDALALDVAPAYWDGRVAEPLEFAIVVEVESITAAAHTYALALQIDSTSAFGSPTTVKTVTLGAVGRVVVPVTREEIEAVFAAGDAFMRLNMDVTGATPSIAFNAYVAPLVG